MPQSKELRGIDPAQREQYSIVGVQVRIVLSITILAATTWTYWNHHHKWFGSNISQYESPLDRVLYTLRLESFAVLPLALLVWNVTNIRTGNVAALNPLSGNEHLVEKANRILTNTVEQFPLHFVSLLTFAQIVSPANSYWIPYLVFCFVFGRFAYAIGYTIHPKHRVFGFVFTLIPSISVLTFNLLRLVGLV